jgi:hypothetical protein
MWRRLSKTKIKEERLWLPKELNLVHGPPSSCSFDPVQSGLSFIHYTLDLKDAGPDRAWKKENSTLVI